MSMETITIDAIPQSTDGLIELRNKIATTPEGGATIMIIAMLKYVEDPDTGLQFFTLALDKSHLSEVTSGVNYKGYAPSASLMYHIKRLGTMGYLAASYITGTSVDGGYKLPSFPYKINIYRNKISDQQGEDLMKVFVECSGADSSRPVTLKKNDKGIWKAYECSSLFVQIRPPKKADAGDDL